MATIDDLPNELLPFIFRNLDLLDLPNARLTCRRWRLFVDECILDELIIAPKRCLNDRYVWWYLDEEVNLRNRISILSFESSFLINLKKVKRLYIIPTIHLVEFDIANLNGFTQLECLQIHYLTYHNFGAIDHSQMYPLRLPELKILSIKFLWVHLVVDAPNLQMLAVQNFDLLHLVHPLTVKHVVINDDKGYDYRSLLNVECLQVLHSDTLSYRMLNEFPNLKAIYCYQIQINDYAELDNLIYAMNNLIEQRVRSHKEHIKIYFKDKELVGNRPFDEYSYYESN